MQTSKYLFAAGLLAAVILPLHVQGGPDSEEQAKLRDALRRAMEQPGASKSQPVAPPATAPAPAQEQAPVTPPPAQQPPPVTPVAPPPATATVVVETPSENVPASDPESMARAREAMRQKMQALQSAPAPAAVTPEPTKPVVAVAPAPPAPKPTPAAEPAAAKPAPKAAPAPVATSNYKPIDAPVSPFSSAKQAKLAELLGRYRADAITSQEYHAQRAAIIAEP